MNWLKCLRFRVYIYMRFWAIIIKYQLYLYKCKPPVIRGRNWAEVVAVMLGYNHDTSVPLLISISLYFFSVHLIVRLVFHLTLRYLIPIALNSQIGFLKLHHVRCLSSLRALYCATSSKTCHMSLNSGSLPKYCSFMYQTLKP